MNGKVHIYKARLVAKGCTQTYGVDYEETFSPVADIRAIRILIAIGVYIDYEIWQMDVKTEFLNGEAAFILEIKIYRDRSRRLIGLSQNAYLDKILKRYRMDNSKRGSIPMQVDLHLKMKRKQNVPYDSAVALALKRQTRMSWWKLLGTDLVEALGKRSRSGKGNRSRSGKGNRSRSGKGNRSSRSETYKNVSQDIRDQLNAKAEAVQITLTGIDNDIYSTVDACPNACEMWKAIERMVKHWNHITQARVANPLALVAQQQPVYHPQAHPTHYTQNSSTRSQQVATRNREKAIVNSS
nr:putative retrotransposon Ty1-copia subclass protein [Tanacetum cinerariifolium]